MQGLSGDKYNLFICGLGLSEAMLLGFKTKEARIHRLLYIFPMKRLFCFDLDGLRAMRFCLGDKQVQHAVFD